MGERLDEILAQCMAMLGIVNSCHSDQIEKFRMRNVAIYMGHESSSTPVIVGINTDGGGAHFSEAPDGYLAGSGSSIEAAARDWRDRLVCQVKRDIVRHESYKAWLNERGLLG